MFIHVLLELVLEQDKDGKNRAAGLQTILKFSAKLEVFRVVTL